MSTCPSAGLHAPPECRCHCGSLLARLRHDGVELKCRRCKRTHLVRWQDVDDWQAPADLAVAPGSPAR